MPAKVKQPQDRKPKKDAADRLREEASNIPGVEETENRKLVIHGRLGSATVTTLPYLDWDAEVIGYLGSGDYLNAICGMVSPEDALRLRAVKPSIQSMMTAVFETDDDSGEESLGESPAS